MLPGWAALALAVILVVISQIKINVTNAYSGSLHGPSATLVSANIILVVLSLYGQLGNCTCAHGRQHVCGIG
jgi:purine-cytosine permease-like protein